MTNVRFTHNTSHVISVGGADHAIFLWQLILPGGGVVNDEYDSLAAQGSEVDEGSDSELSDVASLDSDLEREGEQTYERWVSCDIAVWSCDIPILVELYTRRIFN